MEPRLDMEFADVVTYRTMTLSIIKANASYASVTDLSSAEKQAAADKHALWEAAAAGPTGPVSVGAEQFRDAMRSVKSEALAGCDYPITRPGFLSLVANLYSQEGGHASDLFNTTGSDD